MRKMFVLFACFLLCCVGSASAVTLSLNPSNVTVDIGDTFNITLDAQMLENGVGSNNSNGTPGAISAWDVDVLYNPSQMMLKNATSGGFLGDSVFGVSNNSGVIDIWEISFEDPQDLVDNQPDQFLLALLTFECLRNGVSQVSLLIDDVGDEFGVSVVAHAGAPVTVTQGVPEPSTLMLILTGLMGVHILRRKFK